MNIVYMVHFDHWTGRIFQKAAARAVFGIPIYNVATVSPHSLIPYELIDDTRHKVDLASLDGDGYEAPPCMIVPLSEEEMRLDRERPNMLRLDVRRRQELDQTDQYASPDRPLGEDARADWATYRQALRDLGACKFTADIVAQWPLRPDGRDAIPEFRAGS